MKFYDRYSLKSLENGSLDQGGHLFATPDGFIDLSSVSVVGASVDTFRQLVKGTIKTHVLERVEHMVSEKDQFIHIADYSGKGTIEFSFKRMGMASGYRFIFQNNSLGLTILFGKYHGQLDDKTERSHLKFELSPHFISQRTTQQIHDFIFHPIYGLASYFLQDPSPAGVEVHLAADYQGYQLPSDFVECFKTYSRTLKTYDGISTIDLTGLSEAVATYGRAGQEKNYLVGSRKAVQICLYDKTKEATRSDKIDYFTSEWSIYTMGEYDPTKTTRRIEVRLHHTIVRECGLGQGEDWESILSIEAHLNSLWVYALQKNWLKSSVKSKNVAPFWQLLIQDVRFTLNHEVFAVQRKKKESIDPIAHNLASVIGNMITILNRSGFTPDKIFSQIRILSFYPQIRAYYRQRGMNETDIKLMIREGVKKRNLRGRAA